MEFFETTQKSSDPKLTTVEEEDRFYFQPSPSQTATTILDILGIPVAVSGSQTAYNPSLETDSTDWSWDNIYPKQFQGQTSSRAEAVITPNFNVEGSVDSNTGWSARANYQKGPFQSSATLQKDRAILDAALRGDFAEIRGGLIKERDSDQRTVGASFRVPNTLISFSVDQSKYKNPYGQEKVTEAQGVFSLPEGQIVASFNKNPYQSTKGINAVLNLPENWTASGSMQRTDPVYGESFANAEGRLTKDFPTGQAGVNVNKSPSQTVTGAEAGFNLPENWTASGSMQRTDPVYGEPFYNAEGQLTKTFQNNTIATLIAKYGPVKGARIFLNWKASLN